MQSEHLQTNRFLKNAFIASIVVIGEVSLCNVLPLHKVIGLLNSIPLLGSTNSSLLEMPLVGGNSVINILQQFSSDPNFQKPYVSEHKLFNNVIYSVTKRFLSKNGDNEPS